MYYSKNEIKLTIDTINTYYSINICVSTKKIKKTVKQIFKN